MHRILGRTELDLFRRVSGPDSRQLEWLAGRAAAKEAIRHLLEIQHGLGLPLADIEILPDRWGRLRPDGAWRDRVDGSPSVSISHAGGLAVAVASLSPSMSDERLLGVEVQAVRPLSPGFVDAAFDAEEAEILEGLPTDLREEWTLRAWCAREAVARALGPGLVVGPRPVRLAALDVAREIVWARLADSLIAAFPDLAPSPLGVTTGRHGDLVVATTLCEPAGAEPIDHRVITVLR
jgi:phosphopantetheinyl transferase